MSMLRQRELFSSQKRNVSAVIPFDLLDCLAKGVFEFTILDIIFGEA